MDDIVHVTVIDRLENLLDAVTGVRLGVVLPRDDVLKELAPGDQVKDQVVVALLLDAVVQAY